MLLSIVMASHGSTLHTFSRIAHACTFASEQIEVIVRDNSEHVAKGEFLKSMAGPNRTLIAAPSCGPFENFTKALEAATGRFVFIVSDDDFFFERAVPAILSAAEAYEDDHTVAGITGTYVLEESKGSQFVNYRGLDSRDASERVGGYLDYQGPNLLCYGTVRREVALESWRLFHAHPVEFSFHDQTIVLLTMLAGRFVHINRLVFMYDNSHWETPGRAMEEDLKFYTRAGIDPAFSRLHWLLLGFEGARLITSSPFSARIPPAERQRAANCWFMTMFGRFSADQRGNFGSNFGARADAIATKWRSRYPNFQLDELLVDICGFMQLFAPERAQRYGEFWRSVAAMPPAELGQRQLRTG